MTPKLSEVKRGDYPDWMICPNCLGGRGEPVEFKDEQGQVYWVVTSPCSFCLGNRVISRNPR